jgi:O-antigen biosynthesis rhamnosyltransferase
MKKIRVLHVYKYSSDFSHGGIENFIQTLMLSKESYNKCEAINDKFSDSITIQSTPISFKFLYRLYKKSINYDILNFHYPWPWADLATFFIKKPYVVTYHSDIVRQKVLNLFYTPIKYFFLFNAKKIIATTKIYANSSYTLKFFKKKLEIIPIAITNPPKYQKKNCKWSWLDKEKFFIFFGVLRYYKGIEYLIKTKTDLPYSILIAGSGPEEIKLKLLSEKFNKKNLYFISEVTDSDKFYLVKKSLGVVFPSCFRSEAFGISLLEAAHFKKPLITCNINTGTSFINLNKKTGLVINKKNPYELGLAMDYLYRNPKISNKYGQNAYKRVKELFNVKKVHSAYAEIYKKVLEKT